MSIGYNNINRKEYKKIMVTIYCKKHIEIFTNLLFSLDNIIPLKILSEEMDFRMYFNPLGKFANFYIVFYRKIDFIRYWKRIERKRDELINETD